MVIVMEVKQLNLEALEQERQKVYRKNRNMYILSGILILLGIGITFLFFGGFILLVIAFVLIFVASSDVKKFKKIFKDSVVKKLISEELGVHAIYQRDRGIDMDEINSLRLGSRPDRYQMEDYISCTYNDVFYEMCDCVLEEKVVTRDSHGHRQVSYQKYFKGRIIKIDFKRDIHKELKVVNQPMRGFQAGDLVKFETEVTEFNKKFKCYASSKEDGFYLLTPYMIQKMLELEKMYVGGIYYAVMHDNLYILINNNGDSLEVNISKPLDHKQLERIRADILIGASIINEFRMDSNKFNA